MRMRLVVAMVSLCGLLGSAWTGDARGADAMELDAKASKIEFVGSKPDGKHEGGFKSFSVEAAVDAGDLSDGKLMIEIKTASLWSDATKLTSHLKNPDFFDVRKYPKIQFTSSKMVPGEGGSVKIEGTMEMLGKKMPVTIPAKVSAIDGGLKIDAEFEIDRMKWGMTYGKGKINDEVLVRATMVLK